MARFLLISNGNGEDLSAALIGLELQNIGHEVDAFPIVGKGKAYLNANLNIIGRTKQFPTGGHGYTTFSGRLTELIQGQILYLVRRIFGLLLVAKRYQFLVVVGDVVPVFAAWLTSKPVITYLVAYSTYYEGKLRLPWPCKYCLSSKRFLQIFTRDKLTADDLSIQLHRKAYFVGNPFMDPVLTSCSLLSKTSFRLGLLPGSRRPELDNNLALFLRVIMLMSEEMIVSGEISLDMALVAELDDFDLQEIITREGWNLQVDSGINESTIKIINGSFSINVHRDSFVSVLQSSDVVFSMAGTAAEQSIGLAKPVVQLPGNGPQFTSSFAEAQRRLLGSTIFSAGFSIKDEEIFLKTANLIGELLKRSKTDQAFQEECIKQAHLRLGSNGGTKKIVSQVLELVNSQK